MNLDVDGDDDKEINYCFKDLDFQELENMKANGHHRNIQLITKLYAFKPKLLINYFPTSGKKEEQVLSPY